MRNRLVANKYLDPRTPNSWSGLPCFIRAFTALGAVGSRRLSPAGAKFSRKPAPLRLLNYGAKVAAIIGEVVARHWLDLTPPVGFSP